jgi:hypothetical protein
MSSPQQAIEERLREFIDSLTIVDTHEHMPGQEARRPANSDVLSEWLTHYFSCDLISAGLPPAHLAQVRDPNRPLPERWRTVEPYWRAAHSTGYGRALALAAQGIYGIDHIGGDTIEELNRRFVAARAGGGHYRFVLKEKSRVRISLLDADLGADPEFFVSVIRMDGFLCPTHRRELQAAQERLNTPVHSIRDWKRALEIELDRALHKGAVAVKCGLAYQRSLRFDKTSEAEAEAGFNELFADPQAPEWRPGIKTSKAFQDHMMHHLLALAEQRSLTVQFHTGLQEGNGNLIYDSNPVLLSNLFIEYGGVTFDLFHMGYPYMAEISALAKNFANVCIDMCWGHIISPEASRRALAEWLDAVPANKISAFGGDYCFVDGVYGHQVLARRNVAATLASKVADGSMDVDRATEIARWLFVDNPERIFRLAKSAM